MDEVLFGILKVIIMLAVLLLFRYVIPLVKNAISAKRLEEIEKWVQNAVLMAQQVYLDKTGAERKAIVVDMLNELLEAKNLAISDEQLNVLIEAAVKAMKIEEDKGIKLEPVNQWVYSEGESTVGENADGESVADKAEKE